MKDPDIFGVRGAENRKDSEYIKLKQSILDEPTVVIVFIFRCTYFFFLFLVKKWHSLLCRHFQRGVARSA